MPFLPLARLGTAARRTEHAPGRGARPDPAVPPAQRAACPRRSTAPAAAAPAADPVLVPAVACACDPGRGTRSRPPWRIPTNCSRRNGSPRPPRCSSRSIALAAAALGAENPQVLALRSRRAAILVIGGDFRRALPEFDALADAYARTAGPPATTRWSVCGRRLTAEPNSARPPRRCGSSGRCSPTCAPNPATPPPPRWNCAATSGSLLLSEGRTAEAFAELRIAARGSLPDLRAGPRGCPGGGRCAGAAASHGGRCGLTAASR